MLRSIFVLTFFISSFANSQCGFDNVFIGDATPASAPGSSSVPCIQGGEYVTVNVVQGMMYTFTTCSNNSFDTQITLYDGTSNLLEYNDDACGLQSTVSWMATFDGVVNVMIDEYYCTSNTTCTTLDISSAEPTVLESSNLPIVVISTIGPIVDSPKVDGTMGIIYNGEGVRNYLTDPYNEYFGDIGIEIRGSSSQSFPKKQYGLETRDPMGNSNDVSLFNMAFDNDWVLSAPYSDKSLMRNVLAYKMGWDLGQYSPRTQFCEVIINGDYKGVYVITEKIKNKQGKIGMDDLEPEDLSGNELTGGYIVKVDKLTGGGVVAWTSPFPFYSGSSNYTQFQMHEPDLDSLDPIQLDYIRTYITDFETALDGPNFADPVLGYRPYVDVQSFIDFMIVNELSKNVDGYRISTFLHKHRVSEGGKYTAGPLWDFNLAYGNANYCAGGNTSGWEIYFYTVCGGGGLQNPFWWEKMVQDPQFAKELNCTWQTMRMGAFHTDSILDYIDTIAAYLDESQARNFVRWPILGQYVWPNNFIGVTYAEEIGYLKTWITDRLNWMDQNMFGSCDDLSLESIESPNIIAFPNPVSENLFIDFHENGKHRIELYDLTGKLLFQIEAPELNYIAIPVQMYSSGLYILKVHSTNSEYSTQIAIQH